MDPDLGVSEWYTQNKWFEAYQYSIRPVPGSRHWKPTSFPKPLPPVERKMPGRPRKKRIRHPTENVHGVSRRGRVMHCHKCWEAGHNKKTCTNPERPKPANFFGESSNRMDQEQQSNTNTSSAPAETFSEQMPAYSVDPVLPKPGKRSGVGSKKVSNSGSKKGMTKGSTSVPNKSRFAGSTSNNEPYISPEEHALNMDEEAVREQEIADRAEEEEQERIRFMWEAQEIADLTWEIYSQEFPEYYEDYEDNMKKIAEFNASVPPNMVIPQQAPIHFVPRVLPDQVPTQQSQVVIDSSKNKGKEPNHKNKGKRPADIPDAQDDGQKYKGKKRGRKPKAETPSYGRIYYKNRGRSERIANQKKDFVFDKYGTGSTAEKAFSVD
ncbi:hypothetical protein CTI12_AA107650 [Artemisia annua]|uniref:CCHC-type domain-containing protein n=1 Tax=Artemisia annua TaxID=35608 RepID=A0A2U1PVG0_ARTAN|nr:hypothetical protein CTI12_AA107650 [Artemisia annua]